MTGSNLVRAMRERMTATTTTATRDGGPAARLAALVFGALAVATVGASVTASPDALDFFRMDHAAGNGGGILFSRPAPPPAPVAAAPIRREARAPAPTPAPASAGLAARPSGRFAFCVRLCDGYAFPIGDLRAARDVVVHREACAAACPSAETALYVSDRSRDISDAVALAGGAPYPALATAFLNRERRVDGCACTQPEPLTRRAARPDHTLRPGDVVITSRGAQVLRRDGVFADYDARGAASNSLRGLVAARLGPNHAATWTAYARAQPPVSIAVAALPTRRPADTIVVAQAPDAATGGASGFAQITRQTPQQTSHPASVFAPPLPPRPPVRVAEARPRSGGFVALN